MAGMESTEGVETRVETEENTENIEHVEESVENEADTNPSEKCERIIRLPLTRIKTIMKTDSDVTLASQDAVVLIAKATVYSKKSSLFVRILDE